MVYHYTTLHLHGVDSKAGSETIRHARRDPGLVEGRELPMPCIVLGC